MDSRDLFLDRRGQITLEVIFLIGFFVLVLVAIIFPLGMKSYQSSQDSATVLEMRENLDTIEGAVKVVRAQGPGAVVNVEIVSNYDNWSLMVFGNNLTYWVRWSEEERVSSELLKYNNWGGLNEQLGGIDSKNHFSGAVFQGNGTGRWNIRVEYVPGNATYPNLLISSNQADNEINITLGEATGPTYVTLNDALGGTPVGLD